MKVLFVYNPQSGKKDKSLLTIKSFIDNHQYKSDLFLLDGKSNLNEYIKSKSNNYYDVIVSCGGDGTVNLVVSIIITHHLKAALLIIPLGSTNEYAQELGVNFESVEKSLDLLKTGQISLVDVGQLNDRYFSYIACFGNYTSVSYETPQKMKNLLGHAAYWIYGVYKLNLLRTYRYNVIIDGTEYKDDFLFGLVTNAHQFGRVFQYNAIENVDVQDGLFEVLLIRNPRKIVDFIELLRSMLLHDYNHDFYIKTKAKEIQFSSDKVYAWNVDGEYGGKHKEITIKNLKQKIKVIVKGE